MELINIEKWKDEENTAKFEYPAIVVDNLEGYAGRCLTLSINGFNQEVVDKGINLYCKSGKDLYLLGTINFSLTNMIKILKIIPSIEYRKTESEVYQIKDTRGLVNVLAKE